MPAFHGHGAGLSGGRGGGSGLLIDDELLRAICTESAEALKYWFGIGTHAVWRWRLKFGISQWGTDGSRRLHQLSSNAGAEKTRGRTLPPEQVERRRRTALELGLRPTGRWARTGWRPEQIALLGTMTDHELAAKIGRTVTAVRSMRSRLRRPRARDK